MDRITYEATYACSDRIAVEIAILEKMHLRLCEIEGACPEYFDRISTFLPDIISDMRAKKNAADEAVGEYDVMKAYGERPSQVALVADGASL